MRPAPSGYVWCKSVNETIDAILEVEKCNICGEYLKFDITLLDIDHDAGDFAYDGGDYIKILDWLEETDRNYPIRIHTQNPVGRMNMRAIIEKNNWIEVH